MNRRVVLTRTVSCPALLLKRDGSYTAPSAAMMPAMTARCKFQVSIASSLLHSNRGVCILSVAAEGSSSMRKGMPMTITLLDRSNYYRGLLLLVRKDRKITEREAALMIRIGAKLGFEREFCENALREALDNAHIDPLPPQFSNPELAKKFIKDGLTIAGGSQEMHAAEESWLHATALANGLDSSWYEEVKQSARRHPNKAQTLEVDHLNVAF